MDLSKKINISVFFVVIFSLFLTLQFNLLPALIAGMITYIMMGFCERVMNDSFNLGQKSRFIATIIISLIVVSLITAFSIYAFSWIYRTFSNPTVIMTELTGVIDRTVHTLPPSLSEFFPKNLDNIKQNALDFIQLHLETIKAFGKGATHNIITMILGMIIGIMIAATKSTIPPENEKILVKTIKHQTNSLVESFKHVIVAQIGIAGFNTVMTFLFLVVILPILGIHMPFTKTIIACTFFIGLIPILGNIIVNVIVLLIGLSVSISAGVLSLVFLIFIHKFEYFLNAKIIGSRIEAKAWELLLVMLIMETIFGVIGLIAAPIFYAYIKKELKEFNYI